MRFDVWVACRKALNGWGLEAKTLVRIQGLPQLQDLAMFKDQNQHSEALFFFSVFSFTTILHFSANCDFFLGAALSWSHIFWNNLDWYFLINTHPLNRSLSKGVKRAKSKIGHHQLRTSFFNCPFFPVRALDTLCISYG